MGGGGSTGTNSTVTQQVPQYLEAGQQSAIAQGQALSNTPFQPYTGKMVADLSPIQKQYFQGVLGNQGSWQAPMQAAQGVSANIAGGAYNPTIDQTQAQVVNPTAGSLAANAHTLYDPAVDAEIGGMSRAIQQQTNRSLADQRRQLGNQGAFGGSGSAIRDAQTIQNGQLAIGQYASQLLPKIYENSIGNQLQAAGITNQANLGVNQQNLGFQQLGSQASLGAGNLSLQGAQQLGNQGIQAQQAGYTDTGQLGAAGQALQNQGQANLNWPYQQYQAAQQWPFQTLASEYSALGTVAPYAGGSTTQATPYNPFSGIVGTAIAGAGAANSLLSADGGRTDRQYDGLMGSLINKGIPKRQDAGGFDDVDLQAQLMAEEEQQRMIKENQEAAAQNALDSKGGQGEVVDGRWIPSNQPTGSLLNKQAPAMTATPAPAQTATPPKAQTADSRSFLGRMLNLPKSKPTLDTSNEPDFIPVPGEDGKTMMVRNPAKYIPEFMDKMRDQNKRSESDRLVNIGAALASQGKPGSLTTALGKGVIEGNKVSAAQAQAEGSAYRNKAGGDATLAGVSGGLYNKMSMADIAKQMAKDMKELQGAAKTKKDEKKPQGSGAANTAMSEEDAIRAGA